MHVVNTVLSFLSQEIYWIATLLVGLVTLNFLQLWLKIRELPPGPIPLPIFGNILSFWSEKSVRDILTDFKRQYGGIYTIWVAQRPFVIVSEWKLVKQGLIENRNDIVSKPDMRSMGHCQREFMAIINDKFNQKWAVTRKVAAAAVRKFADGEKMAIIVKNETDKLLEKALKFEGKPYDPSEDLQKVSMNIILQTAFGEKSLIPAEYDRLKWVFSIIQNLGGNMPGDLALWLLVLFYRRDLIVQRMAKTFRDFLQEKYDANKKTFQRGIVRNFSDAVVTCGIEAEEEDNRDKEYLDDINMMKIIGALFLAATESTATTLTWMFLLMANYPECQEKMRREIDQYIGSISC